MAAGDHRGNALGAAPKYSTAWVRYPDPAISPSAFLSEIVALADRLAIDTLIPAADLTTMLLVSQPDLSKFARLAGPTEATKRSGSCDSDRRLERPPFQSDTAA